MAARPNTRYKSCLNKSLKITKISNSARIVLPKEVLTRLRVGVGDELFLSEAPDDIRLTAADHSFAEKMAVAEAVVREDRDILRELTK